MKQIVDSFSLTKWLGTEKAKQQLAMAGYRGPQAEIAFLFFRPIVSIGLFVVATFYMLVLDDSDWPMLLKLGIAIFAAYLGIKAPELFLKDATGKRQVSMRRAFPAAMDLLLICVESGMSIEHAFRKVSQEIGTQSLPLAEEFTLATAELAYLPDRRQASKISARAPESNPFSKSPRCSSRRKIRHAAWHRIARGGAGKSRNAHEHGEKDGALVAAEADRADDPVLSAGSVRRHYYAGDHPGDGDSVNSLRR